MVQFKTSKIIDFLRKMNRIGKISINCSEDLLVKEFEDYNLEIKEDTFDYEVG